MRTRRNFCFRKEPQESEIKNRMGGWIKMIILSCKKRKEEEERKKERKERKEILPPQIKREFN